MSSKQVRLIKVPIAFGQLESHRVHLSRLHFHLAVALESQNMTAALPVVGDKVEVVTMNTNALQIMRLPEAYQGTADVLKGK